MNMNDFEIENGVLKKYKGSGGAVAIPDSVTNVDQSIFSGCSNLTNVKLPVRTSGIPSGSCTFQIRFMSLKGPLTSCHI